MMARAGDDSSYRRAIFHCGLPKTGSTFLQKVFANNIPRLARRSIHYPDARPRERMQGNHSLAFISYAGTGGLKAHLSRRIDLDSPCETILMSGESIVKLTNMPGAVDELASLFPGADPTLVFYIRRFDHMVESIFSEVIKTAPCPDIDSLNYRLDFQCRIDPFARAFGRRSVVIRPYNRRLWAGGQIGPDFCAAIGFPELWPQLDTDGAGRENPSLPRPARFVLARTPVARKPAMLKLLRERPDLLPEDKARFFRSPEQRRAFNRRPMARLEQFAETYRLGDIRIFLDLDNYDDDPDWHPFVEDETLFERLNDTLERHAG